MSTNTKKEGNFKNPKSKELVVDIIIPENLMNDDLKSHYNKEESKLVYQIGDNYTEEFINELKDVTSELNSKQLAVFNPIISILKGLDEIKTLTPTGDDKEDEKLFKEANKFIRSFNGTNKKAKDELKRPILDLGKKIQGVYNVLSEESEITKNALEENFKELIEKKEAEKQAKIDKEKAEELARIEELNRQNEETNKKLRDQEKMNQKLTIESMLKDIFYNSTNKIDEISEEGLSKRVNILNKLSFIKYMEAKGFDLSIFDEKEISDFESLYNSQVKQSVTFIEYKLEYIEQSKAIEKEKMKSDIKEEIINTTITEKETPTPPADAAAPPAPPKSITDDLELVEISVDDPDFFDSVSDEEMFEFLQTHLDEIKKDMDYYLDVANRYNLKDESNKEKLDNFKSSFNSQNLNK